MPETVAYGKCHPGIYCRDPSDSKLEIREIRKNCGRIGLAGQWVPGIKPGMTSELRRNRRQRISRGQINAFDQAVTKPMHPVGPLVGYQRALDAR